MRTTKPISTISFNTESYLKGILQTLEKAKIITLWHYIEHRPEDDEGGNKKHFHVYIEPSKLLQTDDLREQFREIDPSKPDKPLGVLPFRNSRFDSWYMYGLHDKAYLASKGQERKYHYHHEDMHTSDEDMLRYQAKTIDLTALSPYAAMVEAQDLGLTWDEYMSRGTIPIPQINQFEKAWHSLLNARAGKSKTDRGDSQPHIMSLTDEEQDIIIQRRLNEEAEKKAKLQKPPKEQDTNANTSI